jgi:hypothetical protein
MAIGRDTVLASDGFLSYNILSERNLELKLVFLDHTW